MRTAGAFLKRDFLVAISYKADFVVQLLSILVTVPAAYFISRMVATGRTTLLDRYGGDLFSFVLLGVAFTDYHVLSLRTFNASLRESQLMGTLETILLSPTSIRELLLYSSLWGYLLTTLRFALYLAVGVAFGLHIGHANAGAALGILALAITVFAAVGVLIAAVTMVVKRGEFLITAVTGASAMLSGVLFPVALLPGWLQAFSHVLPMTAALEGMRLALIQGYSARQLGPQFLALAIFAVVLVPLCLIAFGRAIRWTKVAGTMGQY